MQQMNLANKIEAARKAKKLSRKELGDLVFASEHTVKSWETMKHRPRKATLKRLEHVLGFKASELSDAPKSISETIKRLETTLKKLPPNKRDQAIALISSLNSILE